MGNEDKSGLTTVDKKMFLIKSKAFTMKTMPKLHHVLIIMVSSLHL